MKFYNKILGLVLFLCVFVFCNGLTPSTFLTTADQQRLKKVISSAFPLNDLVTGHYAVLGYTLLNEKLPEDPCKFFESKIDKKRLDTIFHASSGGKLANCKINSAGLQQVLEQAITEDAPMQDIYHAALSLKNLNLKVDSPKITKVVSAALKRDDNVINLAYAFHIACVLQGDITTFFERIEDVIVQADEVDGKFLQFEGGLGITATTISGVYKLAALSKKAPAVTPEQAVKFTNYFLSRKFVQTVKGSAQLLEVLKIFTTNKFHVPVAITLASNSALSDENKFIQVRITDVMGASLGPLTVTLDNAKRSGDDVVVMSKKPFQAVEGSNNILHKINFLTTKQQYGFYTVTISAVPAKADPKLIGNTGAQISVTVMTQVAVEGAEIGTAYRDQVSATKTTSITYPQSSVKLDVDSHQKIFMKFALKDKDSNKGFVAHQAFVQFSNQKTGQEVVFVAEPDSSSVYRFDLDVSIKGKDFMYSSGVYDIKLIVGDAVLKNPIAWKLGEVTFSFQGTPSSKSTENPYQPKPEIRHMFREKEKRPSSLVSNTFSVLCTVPLLLLLILWLQLGANLSNFPCSIYTLCFHGGLLAIFSLFACFWLHLNMFATLKYLLGIGLFTYVSGHKLLSKLAASK